jgi:type VI secretion system protein ImpH
MATARRRKSVALKERLLGEPQRFDFFQAVRMLERLAAATHSTRLPARARRYPVGEDRTPEEELIAFRAVVALSFPPNAIAKLRDITPDAGTVSKTTSPMPRFEMDVSFFGLTGPNGVLPRHYTKLILTRVRTKDFTLRDWLDLFNHRLLSLFYRAWAKYRLPVMYERTQYPLLRDQSTALTQGLFSLVGLGTHGLRERRVVDDELFVYYAGLFANQTRNASALGRILADYFSAPVEVLQFQGQWLTLDLADCCSMSTSSLRRVKTNQLGISAIAGRRVWDVQSNIRLRIGPVNFRQFRQLLPKTNGLKAICQLTRAYIGPGLGFDVQPILKKEEIPVCTLKSDSPARPQLGYTTWSRSPDRGMTKDSDAAVFQEEL